MRDVAADATGRDGGRAGIGRRGNHGAFDGDLDVDIGAAHHDDIRKAAPPFGGAASIIFPMAQAALETKGRGGQFLFEKNEPISKRDFSFGSCIGSSTIGSTPGSGSRFIGLPAALRALRIALLRSVWGAEAEQHRIARPQVGRVPVRAVAHRGDGLLGGADQARDLRICQFRVMPHQPSHRIRLILALRDRRVARTLAAGQRQRDRDLRHLQALGRILLAALDLFLGELAVAGRVEADDTDRDLAVGNALDFQRVQIAEGADLLEGQRGVLDQPDGGRLRHQKLWCSP